MNVPLLPASWVNLLPRLWLAVIPTLLGLVLLIAAALKGHELATEPTLGTGFLASRGFLIPAVEFELALGLWLLAGFLPKLARSVSVACFTGFLGVAFYQAGSGETSCGCFGKVTVNPWYTAAFDFAAIVALLSWRAVNTDTAVRQRRLVRYGACVLIFLLAGIFGGIAMAGYRLAVLTPEGDFLGDGDTVLLEPEKWVGKRLPLLKSIDIGEELAQGNWLLTLYRHDCAKCEKLVSELEKMARAESQNPTMGRIVFIEVPPYGRPVFGAGASGSPCKVGRLSDRKKWVVPTPTMLLLEQAVVSAAETTAHPSGLSSVNANDPELWERGP